MMKDSEGDVLPLDIDGSVVFDLNLWGDGQLSLNIPMQFETLGIDMGGDIYNSAGVLVVSLGDILEEYLRDFKGLDEGKDIPYLSKMLRDYADKYDAAYKRSAIESADSL